MTAAALSSIPQEFEQLFEVVKPTAPMLSGDREMDANRGRIHAERVVSYMRHTRNLPYLQIACKEATNVGGPFKRAFYTRLAELLV